jgi:hypothetical protein
MLDTDFTELDKLTEEVNQLGKSLTERDQASDKDINKITCNPDFTLEKMKQWMPDVTS